MMDVFIGSFVVFVLSGLALGLGLLVLGKPLQGGCSPKGEDCQNNCRKRRCPKKVEHHIYPPEG